MLLRRRAENCNAAGLIKHTLSALAKRLCCLSLAHWLDGCCNNKQQPGGTKRGQQNHESWLGSLNKFAARGKHFSVSCIHALGSVYDASPCWPRRRPQPARHPFWLRLKRRCDYVLVREPVDYGSWAYASEIEFQLFSAGGPALCRFSAGRFSCVLHLIAHAVALSLVWDAFDVGKVVVQNCKPGLSSWH